MSLEINKQKMKYSLSLGLQPQYRRDDDGNIIYTGYTDDDGTFIPYLDEDGNKIPEVTGEPIETYTDPVIFYSSISNKLSEATAKEFGIAEYALRRWVKSGELPCIHCGRRILINCSVLSEFLSCQSSVQNAVAVDERGNYYKPSGSGKIRPIAL